jgi:hypothetical protein
MAIDNNAFLMRILACLAIVILSLNPLILVALKTIIGDNLPSTFCDDLVLDIDGTADCKTDTDNTGLYLKKIMVSGRGCSGKLSSKLYTAPVISVWASNANDLTVEGVRAKQRVRTTLTMCSRTV